VKSIVVVLALLTGVNAYSATTWEHFSSGDGTAFEDGDDAVKRSVEAAVYRSSPLPEPSNPALFRPILVLNLRPDRED